MLPTEVRLRAGETRDAARKLVKQLHLMADRAGVLIREVESAIAEFRETIWRAAS